MIDQVSKQSERFKPQNDAKSEMKKSLNKLKAYLQSGNPKIQPLLEHTKISKNNDTPITILTDQERLIFVKKQSQATHHRDRMRLQNQLKYDQNYSAKLEIEESNRHNMRTEKIDQRRDRIKQSLDSIESRQCERTRVFVTSELNFKHAKNLTPLYQVMQGLFDQKEQDRVKLEMESEFATRRKQYKMIDFQDVKIQQLKLSKQNEELKKEQRQTSSEPWKYEPPNYSCPIVKILEQEENQKQQIHKQKLQDQKTFHERKKQYASRLIDKVKLDEFKVAEIKFRQLKMKPVILQKGSQSQRGAHDKSLHDGVETKYFNHDHFQSGVQLGNAYLEQCKQRHKSLHQSKQDQIVEVIEVNTPKCQPYDYLKQMRLQGGRKLRLVKISDPPQSIVIQKYKSRIKQLRLMTQQLDQKVSAQKQIVSPGVLDDDGYLEDYYVSAIHAKLKLLAERNSTTK